MVQLTFDTTRNPRVEFEIACMYEPVRHSANDGASKWVQQDVPVLVNSTFSPASTGRGDCSRESFCRASTDHNEPRYMSSRGVITFGREQCTHAMLHLTTSSVPVHVVLGPVPF